MDEVKMECPPGWREGREGRILRTFGDAIIAVVLRRGNRYVARVKVAEADIHPPGEHETVKIACDQAICLVWGFADNALRDAEKAMAQAGINPFEFRAKWRGSEDAVTPLKGNA